MKVRWPSPWSGALQCAVLILQHCGLGPYVYFLQKVIQNLRSQLIHCVKKDKNPSWMLMRAVRGPHRKK